MKNTNHVRASLEVLSILLPVKTSLPFLKTAFFFFLKKELASQQAVCKEGASDQLISSGLLGVQLYTPGLFFSETCTAV